MMIFGVSMSSWIHALFRDLASSSARLHHKNTLNGIGYDRVLQFVVTAPTPNDTPGMIGVDSASSAGNQMRDTSTPFLTAWDYPSTCFSQYIRVP